MKLLGLAILVAVASSFAAAWPAAGYPHPIDPATLRNAIDRVIRSGRVPEARWPAFPDVRDAVRALYDRSGSAPLWSDLALPTASARSMIATFERAADLGLSPDDYDASGLRVRARSLETSDEAPTPTALAVFDVMLTVDGLRFVSALHHGRVSPRVVHATLDLPRNSFDAAGIVDSLRRTSRAEPLLEAIQPPFLHYRLLRDALARYLGLARDTSVVPLPRFGSPLRPGATYPGAGRLRRLLLAIGDLPDTMRIPARGDTVYDANLVAAVGRFQRRHGFTADGVISTMTERGLREPFGARIRQIELTLERWRWMPRTFDAPPVFVNVPAFRLYAFRTMRDEEAELLAMDVQVGRAFDHRTPLFAASMRYLVFRPFWEVTPTIALREIRPKARRDPGYLARERLELIQDAGEGAALPATPANIDRIGLGVRVRQRPGPGNALGDVKFIFPNQHNVYLHDTPAKSLFEKPRRDFSHGCIRLSQPLQLAELLLRDQTAWGPERIRAAMAADHPTQVSLSRPVPVYILYATAMARENGSVLFYPDLYKHDLELDHVVQRGYPYQ